MQPLKLVIPGRFWDSLLYSGRLYLFTTRGELVVVNWDQLVSGIRVMEPERLALRCAFQRSDYLYGGRWGLLFEDREIREAIERKFNSLATAELQISADHLRESTVSRQANPFTFPHTDCTIYYGEMYAGGTDGLFSAAFDEEGDAVVTHRATRLWDAPSLSIAAGWRSLAVAAGSEGLYEVGIDVEGAPSRREPRLIGKGECSACNWTFFSIFASSHLGGGWLADFKMFPDEHGRKTERVLERVLTAEDLFGRRSYSWGAQEKICQAFGGLIRVCSYNPWAKDERRRVVDLGTLELAEWKGEVVSGGVAPFGTIVECDNAIVVIPSSGPPAFTIAGEPVNWRIFPRAKYYTNQLHVIFEDRLEIHSFNHDYFVKQPDKVSGTKYRSFGGRSRATAIDENWG